MPKRRHLETDRFITNPESRRRIKIDGVTYRELVRKNLLGLTDEMDKNRVVYTATEAELDAVAKAVKQVNTQINPPPPGKYYARKNGAIRERKKTKTRAELTDDIIRRCVNLFYEHKRLFAKDISKAEMHTVMYDLVHRNLGWRVA